MKNGVSTYRSLTTFSSACSFHDAATASLYGIRSAVMDLGPRCLQPLDTDKVSAARARSSRRDLTDVYHHWTGQLAPLGRASRWISCHGYSDCADPNLNQITRLTVYY